MEPQDVKPPDGDTERRMRSLVKLAVKCQSAESATNCAGVTSGNGIARGWPHLVAAGPEGELAEREEITITIRMAYSIIEAAPSECSPTRIVVPCLTRCFLMPQVLTKSDAISIFGKLTLRTLRGFLQ